MIEVDNFLVVFSLEVGGKFIGFFALITNVIVITLAFLLLIAVSIDKDLVYLRQNLDELEISTFNLPEVTNLKAIQQLREYVIISLVLLMIISAIYIIAGFLLVRGTRNVSETGSEQKKLD
jgi:Na+/melibiose symporter-like transporter